MNKRLLILIIALGFPQLSSAQLDFGVKAGLNYTSLGKLKNDISNLRESSDARVGFHLGAFTRLSLIGFSLRPELIYSQINSRYKVSKADYKLQNIDIPVLFEKKILMLGSVFIGPNFSYTLNSTIDKDEFKKNKSTNFSVGITVGAGLEIGKLGVDLRYVRGLSKSEALFVKEEIKSLKGINVDNRINQVTIGLHYRLFG